MPYSASVTQGGAGSPPPLVEVNQAILAWSFYDNSNIQHVGIRSTNIRSSSVLACFKPVYLRLIGQTQLTSCTRFLKLLKVWWPYATFFAFIFLFI